MMAFGSRFTLALQFCVLGFFCSSGRGQDLTFAPAHPSGIYKVGEKVEWTITRAAKTADLPDHFKWEARRNNWEPVKSGNIDLASGKATISVDGAEPEMLY